jgi:hypothetical protein
VLNQIKYYIKELMSWLELDDRQVVIYEEEVINNSKPVTSAILKVVRDENYFYKD